MKTQTKEFILSDGRVLPDRVFVAFPKILSAPQQRRPVPTEAEGAISYTLILRTEHPVQSQEEKLAELCGIPVFDGYTTREEYPCIEQHPDRFRLHEHDSSNIAWDLNSMHIVWQYLVPAMEKRGFTPIINVSVFNYPKYAVCWESHRPNQPSANVRDSIPQKQVALALCEMAISIWEGQKEKTDVA